MSIDTDSIRQAAAIPIRNGTICLVTSRSGKRWVVPKGGMEPGKTAGEIALQEAWEEAGLTGVLQREPVGSFLYEKFGSQHLVTVFLMRVTEETDTWPEDDFRERVWVSPAEAIDRIDDEGLREIIRSTVTGNGSKSGRVKIS
ncbi:MAG: NUDIX hydrolase [Planctomycetia bacterium]|nr:NUDIX hydrolase [Planctomycetia bacterium]